MNRRTLIAVSIISASFSLAFGKCEVFAAPKDEKNPVNETSDSKVDEAAAKDKSEVKKSDLEKGRAIFRTSCVSCHPGGENLAKRSKPIIGSWTLATLATFKSYLAQPVGTMPHYKHIVNSEKNLEFLYKYVKTLDKAKAPAKAK